MRGYPSRLQFHNRGHPAFFCATNWSRVSIWNKEANPIEKESLLKVYTTLSSVESKKISQNQLIFESKKISYVSRKTDPDWKHLKKLTKQLYFRSHSANCYFNFVKQNTQIFKLITKESNQLQRQRTSVLEYARRGLNSFWK